MNRAEWRLRVAAVQLKSGRDRAVNHERIRELMTEAADAGASLITLPENFSYIGEDPDEKLSHAEDLERSPSAQLLSTFALDRHVAIVGGSIPLRTADPRRVTNSTLVFDDTGTLVARYDKIHLFDADLDSRTRYRESAYVLPGSTPVCVNLGGWRFGLTICYDLRFPELYRSLAADGASVLLVPSAFTRQTGKDHWEVLLRARAIENLCYVVAPAQWGDHTTSRASYGDSMVVDPWGHVICRRRHGEGFVTAELDASIIEQARNKLPGIVKRS